MRKIITNSEIETINLGKKFAQKFHGGEVIALSGDLGAGKTMLIKGIAKGLRVKKIITSPTFILMNVYKVKNPKSEIRNPKQIQNSNPESFRDEIQNFIHIDCYRIKNEKDILNIGAQEYFGRSDSIVVIEWAEKIKKILPKDRIEIKIKIEGEIKRELTIS